MSATEEQEQELEVLESIYPDELTKKSATEFSILISIEEPGVDTETEGYEAPSIILSVVYTTDYPNSAPELSISLPPSSSSQPHPIDLSTDEPTLLSALHTAVSENLGMAMIFSLTTTLKESAESILRGRYEAVLAARTERARIEEEKENEKFRGEIVTKEVFERWREGFMKEMKEKKEREEKEREEELLKSSGGGKKGGNVGGLTIGGRRMTGREMFEKGLAGGVDDDAEIELEEDENVKVPDVGKLNIKA